MIKKRQTDFLIRVDKMIKEAKDRSRVFVVEFLQDLNEATVMNTPVGLTGFLRGSWSAMLNGPPADMGAADKSGSGSLNRMNLHAAGIKLGDKYYARNGAAYAVHVEYGTKPHVIRPRKKKALYFKRNGKYGFAMQVNHPGTPPRAFVRATVAAAPMIARAALDRVKKL